MGFALYENEIFLLFHGMVYLRLYDVTSWQNDLYIQYNPDKKSQHTFLVETSKLVLTENEIL